MTALQLSAKIKSKEISVVQAVKPYLDLAETNAHNAFVRFDAQQKQRALERAEAVQNRINAGELADSPLAGVPVALKDNISVLGEETTACSKMLGGFKPVFNATVVEKLERAGLVLTAKTNMDEFAVGTTGESSVYGAVLNPRDKSRTTGGSSSGSAAAVASGEVPLSLGSDTGGSIRLPAAYCGAVAIKPTYGSVSRHGLFALASSMEQIGTVASNVDDAAALLAVISGADEFDGTCVIPSPLDFSANREKPQNLQGVKIACIAEVPETAKTALKSAGAQLTEIALPLREYLLPTYFVIACAETASNFARYDGLKFGYRSPNAKSLNEIYRLSRTEGFGDAVKLRIMFGSMITSGNYYDKYFAQALKVRGMIKREYDRILSEYDAVLTPVSPQTAPKIGETTAEVNETDIFLVAANLAGLPAVALPYGECGLQLIGGAFRDSDIVHIARICEQEVKS
jgi:aspartyl-tRNA(Asn)/glutamyl-tRNA(Gln) amidotransferase subunit A